MKLNKMEISAIAENIYKDVNKKVSDYNKKVENSFDDWFEKFKKTPNYKDFAELISCAKLISTRFERSGITYYVTNLAKFSVEEIVRPMFRKEIESKLKKNKVDISQIKNDIIIAQVKNEDLDSLIKQITEKYSK